MQNTTAPAKATEPMDLEMAAQLIDLASCITILLQKYRKPGAPDSEEKYRYRLCLVVRRTQKRELQDLVGALGVEGKISAIHSRVKETERHVTNFEVVWGGESAINVLETVFPFLKERKEEAKIALKFWKAGGYKEYRKGLVPKELWPVRDQIYDQMRELKDSLKSRARLVSAPRDLARLQDSKQKTN